MPARIEKFSAPPPRPKADPPARCRALEGVLALRRATMSSQSDCVRLATIETHHSTLCRWTYDLLAIKRNAPETTAPTILIGGRSDFLLAAPLDIPGEREQPQPEMLADFLRFTRLVAPQAQVVLFNSPLA